MASKRKTKSKSPKDKLRELMEKNIDWHVMGSLPKTSVMKVSSIDKTLADREKRYGSFVGHALITQSIKNAMRMGKNWNFLSPEMKEALEMTAHKIGRILNGDQNYRDSWHDIIGYIKLIDDALAEPIVKGEWYE